MANNFDEYLLLKVELLFLCPFQNLTDLRNDTLFKIEGFTNSKSLYFK